MLIQNCARSELRLVRNERHFPPAPSIKFMREIKGVALILMKLAIAVRMTDG